MGLILLRGIKSIIGGGLGVIKCRTRENRNMATVTSTESRIFWFAVLESCLMVAMAGVQVYFVQSFFSKGSGSSSSMHKRMI
jgi:hypothetical protein